MSALQEIDYQRYLRSKETVDDRTLDHHVWTEFTDALTRWSGREIRVLELGGGIGSMLKRIIDLNPHGLTSYTLVDQKDKNILHAKNYLSSLPYCEINLSNRNEDRLSLNPEAKCTTVNLICNTIEDWLRKCGGQSFNVLILQSILDLLSTKALLSSLKPLLHDHCLIYSPNNFDGLTHFLPSHPLDEKVIGAYHASMDNSDRDGSQTGRKLPPVFREQGYTLKALGSSDWTVLGDVNQGAYSHDEGYFLKCILYFIEDSLTDSKCIDPKDLEDWLSTRHKQLDHGQLIYIAHQLDLLASRND
jgi:SAM-dependent methyltransferase